MPELLVPESVENPFRELYRGLIVSSIQHSIEQQKALDRNRRRGRRWRGSRFEHAPSESGGVVADAPVEAAGPLVATPVEKVALAPAVTPVRVRLEPPAPVVQAERPGREAEAVLPLIAAEPLLGAGVRRAAAAVWGLTLAVLVVNTIVVGFDSWVTGASDLALITMTLAWFAISISGAESSHPV